MAVDYSAFRSSAEDDALYDVKPFNYASARKLLVKRIERAARHVSGELKSGQKDYGEGYQDRLRYRPTLLDQRITVEAADEDYFPIRREKFATFAKSFIDDVNAGEYDAQLEALYAAAQEATKGTPVKARRKRTAGGALKPAPVGYNAIRKSVGTSVNRFKKPIADVKADLLARGADKVDVEKAIKAVQG